MASILDELVEAMTQEKDPKRLTQKQQDRLAKRVKDIAEQHKTRLEKSYKEQLSEYKTTTVSSYNNGYREERVISADSLARQTFLERVGGKKYSFDTKALLADLATHCRRVADKSSGRSGSFTVQIQDYMPEARKRIQQQDKTLKQLKQKKQEVEYQITFDMNEIIDAAIFYRSEHILNVLETFSAKEYAL